MSRISARGNHAIQVDSIIRIAAIVLNDDYDRNPLLRSTSGYRGDTVRWWGAR
jgi:hypothetical protein